MRISRSLGIMLLVAFSAAAGQESRSFNAYIENDAFINSDTGYTNGLRLSWALNRYKPWMPAAIRFAGPQALLSGPGWFGFDKDTMYGHDGCQPGDTRATRRNGRCYMLLLGIAQTMYTPSNLLQVNPDPEDRPFSGFLFATIGGAYLDSPALRTGKGKLVMTQVSNELVLGTTGPAAIARETQSIAHWTWSNGAPRPLGWTNQLKGGFQVGLLTRGALRWSSILGIPLEYCASTGGCSGGIDESRIFDFTPRFETVLGTWMRRASIGGVLRIGCGFPDNLSSDRIPTAKGKGVGGAIKSGCKWIQDIPHSPWFNVFFTADERWVQHNMFIQGGYRDDASGGWKSTSRLKMRPSVFEGGVLGLAVGTGQGSLSIQFVQRTPEYDVLNKPPFHGFARYGSLNLTINTMVY